MYKRQAANSGFISTYCIFTEDVVSPFAYHNEIEEGVASGRVLKADTLAELADKINAFAIKGQYPAVQAANLEATVAAHNSYIDSMKDPDFGKVMAKTMVKICLLYTSQISAVSNSSRVPLVFFMFLFYHVFTLFTTPQKWGNSAKIRQKRFIFCYR